MGKKSKNVIWLGVSLLAIGYVLSTVSWDELKDAISNVSWPWVICATALMLAAQTMLAGRWLLLLRVHRIYISFYQAVKLTYLGLFYNNMMPGAVGGDLLKAWFITHHSDRDHKLEAMVTVFIDRLSGLVCLVLVGAIASFFVGGGLDFEVAGHKIQVRSLIWLIFAAMAVASIIFISRRTRRILMLSRLLKKLPFARKLQQIDSAIRIYRQHLPTVIAAILWTVFIQGTTIMAIWMLTQGLHLDKVLFVQCLSVMPIIWLVSVAVPVPGGLGVLEYLFIPFFAGAIDPAGAMDPAVVNAQAAALALLNRMMICLCSIPGALVPIFGGHLPKAQEIQQELE